ncbi:MAG: hypothetical protein QOE90_2419 [Thermoplasmata archaeon]|jgi:hypothetical protein|nr:hypothetical protein [Thermoplasmata archaeon]
MSHGATWARACPRCAGAFRAVVGTGRGDRLRLACGHSVERPLDVRVCRYRGTPVLAVPWTRAAFACDACRMMHPWRSVLGAVDPAILARVQP